eukprot:2560109-Amphidinium_carterae.1
MLGTQLSVTIRKALIDRGSWSLVHANAMHDVAVQVDWFVGGRLRHKHLATMKAAHCPISKTCAKRTTRFKTIDKWMRNLKMGCRTTGPTNPLANAPGHA